MALFITSFLAGLLTILAPCVLPLLPVTLGGAVTGPADRKRPLVIIGSLSASVFVFTLLLKGSTALLDVSPTFWTYVSAAILGAFGLSLVFPYAWARLMLKLPGNHAGERALSNRSAVVVGAALGPVFTTCSPTFFLILATVLPQSFDAGIADLVAYILGLALSLLVVAYIGQKLIDKLGWAIDPEGWFRKCLGALFVVIAVFIAFGWDKTLESAILRAGFFDVTTLEQSIHQSLERSQPSVVATSTAASPAAQAPLDLASLMAQKIPGEEDGGAYTEIADPAGFVNSSPFRLADLIGTKVILLDFIDYSCINCERTFPYLADWWKKYKDQGLEVVAIHTPEFSFEKDSKNVAAAAKQFGLEFPIVLDNGYGTWNAYHNEYWPHKYIIDIHGRVVYEHIGEGEYDFTEAEIVKQLNVRKMALAEGGAVAQATSTMPAPQVMAESPETYFGASRNQYFGNGAPGAQGASSYAIPGLFEPDRFYLGGEWRIAREYAEPTAASAQISYEFTAAGMYLVAESKDGSPIRARVLLDGQPMPAAQAGDDVKDGILTIQGSRLYRLFKSPLPAAHRIDIIFAQPGARLYTFTFG